MSNVPTSVADTDQAATHIDRPKSEYNYPLLKDIKNIVYLVTLIASSTIFIFTLGRTFTSVTESFVTHDVLKDQLHAVLAEKNEVLADIDSRVTHTEQNLDTIQRGVDRLLKQSEAEAVYTDAQELYQKYLKDWDDQLKTWDADRNAGSRVARPVKRTELLKAELAVTKAKSELMLITSY